MSPDSLINKGIVIANPATDTLQKTIIVVGAARGGTSIIAGALFHLGVFMGQANAPVYEDLRLSLAFEKQSKEKFEHVIKSYNLMHDVWAWKRPSSLSNLSSIAKKVRNPHFIFVFRDFLSIANRNKISMKQGVIKGLENAFNDYEKIIKFLKKTNAPSLLISSEKAIKYKHEFIDSLNQFLSLNPSEIACSAALEFVTPNPSLYLKRTRINNANGWIDEKALQFGLLKGWAYLTRNKAPVNVSVYLNGKVIKTLPATLFNEAYKNPIHPTGNCGFEMNLLDYRVTPSDVIEVKPEGDEVNLHNSTLDLSHLFERVTQDHLDAKVKPIVVVNLDVLQTGLLLGWARNRSLDEPTLVSIYINDAKFAMVPAVIYREHFKHPNIHPSGECGFELNLKKLGVKPSDKIEVCMEEDDMRLYSQSIAFPELDEWLTQKELQERRKVAQLKS